MTIAIRADVAKGKPYNQLIERLLAEHRQVVVYPGPRDNCARAMFVFYEGHTSLVALQHHVLLFLKRTHPEHDPVYALNEDLPVEVEALIADLKVAPAIRADVVLFRFFARDSDGSLKHLQRDCRS